MAFAGCTLKKEIRHSILNVIKAFFQIKIITTIFILYTYLGIVVLILWCLKIWDFSQLKSTLIFSVAVGIASLFRLPNASDDTKFFRHWIDDNLKVIVLVEFIATFYTFNIIIEFILVPALVFIGGLLSAAEHNEKHKSVAHLINNLLSAFGLFLIVYAIYTAIKNPESFLSWQTFHDFYTPIILSFLLLPFVKIIHIYSVYEQVFATLGVMLENEELRSYAKHHAFFSFGPSIVLLNRWKRHIAIHRPQNRNDVDTSINEVLRAHKRELHPTEVSASDGWSPYTAKDFLHDSGLITGDYHRVHDDWFASSPYKEIGDAPFPDNIAYYVEGDEKSVSRLKLILNVNNPQHPGESERQFRQLAQSLVDVAIAPYPLPSEGNDFETLLKNKRITMRTIKWEGGIPGGYEIQFRIENEPSSPLTEQKTSIV